MYGLDATLYHDKIFAIYNEESIDSMGMLQQINRSINCDEDNVLFIQEEYNERVNQYITFDRISDHHFVEDYLNVMCNSGWNCCIACCSKFVLQNVSKKFRSKQF